MYLRARSFRFLYQHRNLDDGKTLGTDYRCKYIAVNYLGDLSYTVFRKTYSKSACPRIMDYISEIASSHTIIIISLKNIIINIIII